MKIGFNLDQIIQEDHRCPIYSVKFNDTSSCYFHYFASGKSSFFSYFYFL